MGSRCFSFGLIPVLAVITQSHVWVWKFFYMCNFLSINSQNAMNSFLCKNKTQLALSRQIWQKSKQKKGRPFLEKRLFSKRFHISFNHSYGNTKQQREKYRQDVSVNLSEKTPTITQAMTYKFSMYLLGMLNYIENFTILMNESPN